jgi:hypothetical protein
MAQNSGIMLDQGDIGGTTFKCRTGESGALADKPFFFTLQGFTTHCKRKALMKLPQLGGGALML